MKSIIHKFNVRDEVLDIVEYNIGLINNTYLVTGNKDKYILQRINKSIFLNPEELMKNIDLVTNYLTKKGFTTLKLIKSKQDHLYVLNQGEYWRMYKYIPSISFHKADNIHIASESAKQLAKFHKHLYSFNKYLFSSIKDFHNTSIVFKKFKDVLLTAQKNLLDDCFDLVQYVLINERKCECIQKLLAQNKLPLRVCHNDPKISNFLFDKKLHAICIIDLDTLMYGTLLIDIADAIRSICVSENEDECDLSKLYFQYDYFEEFIKSYLNENKMYLNTYELNNIVISIELIFLEQGIRFLTDYLNGNSYFKINYANQNLARAKNQFYFSKEVANNKNRLDLIISKYIK